MKTEPIARQFYGVDPEKKTDLRGNFERFIERLQREWHRGWPVIVLIDGKRTGVGKSTLGIRICRRLDPSFDLDHFAFRGLELERLYATLPPWTMVQLDEPRDLIASKGTRDRELLHIAAALGSVRKNQIGTVLIAPKKEMFDSLILNGLAPYWIFLEDRGVGRVHRAWTGATYKKSQRFVPYDRTRIDKIGFASLDRDPFFQKYVDLAVRKNREFFAEAREARRWGAPRPGPTSAPATPNLTDTSRSMSPSPPPPPPPPRTWSCGRFVFTRRDLYQRHLLTRAHREGCGRSMAGPGGPS